MYTCVYLHMYIHIYIHIYVCIYTYIYKKGHGVARGRGARGTRRVLPPDPVPHHISARRICVVHQLAVYVLTRYLTVSPLAVYVLLRGLRCSFVLVALR